MLLCFLLLNTFKITPSNKLALYSLNEDTIEISAVECLSICQFKIGQGEYTRKKMDWTSLLPPVPIYIYAREKKIQRGIRKW